MRSGSEYEVRILNAKPLRERVQIVQVSLDITFPLL